MRTRTTSWTRASWFVHAGLTHSLRSRYGAEPKEGGTVYDVMHKKAPSREKAPAEA
jgi:hypothetical protein